ncbi:ABC transporter substrate-binding protein [Anopheles sinensis]|uniref:ABC transporter substrate-binding protein n=1 Tax=Anopheles sinensis TaxID=74873 RepID=A0A084WUB4_ANOSI|nr:ABC transporter substrate-binding protein [Anopheles sinensis]
MDDNYSDHSSSIPCENNGTEPQRSGIITLEFSGAHAAVFDGRGKEVAESMALVAYFLLWGCWWVAGTPFPNTMPPIESVKSVSMALKRRSIPSWVQNLRSSSLCHFPNTAGANLSRKATFHRWFLGQTIHPVRMDFDRVVFDRTRGR